MKLTKDVFKPSSNIPKSSKGSAGFDNPRENIDPQIKTKVLYTREGLIEKSPTDNNHIVNKAYCDSHAVPQGLIAMWHGLIANIPTGWALCDGTNGTPDLRSKFVKGATAATEAGGTGGSATHNHTFTGSALAGHTHTVGVGDHTHAININTEAASTGISTGVNSTVTIVDAPTTPAVFVAADRHTHSITDPTHSHAIDDDTSGPDNISNATTSSTSGGTPAGSISTVNGEPPYYTILFIMKT